MGIALFVLGMASINIINITIGNSLKRAKEVGIRKIVGGSRRQIIAHFLNESAILCFIAFLLSLLLMQVSLPWFNNLSGKQLPFSEALDAKLLLYATAVLVAIMLLTGLYPAYIVSRFKPSEVLYNKQKLTGRRVFGRSLVVVQFSLAVFLLIATLVYYRQMQFIRTKNLGYNPSQIIHTAVSGDRDYKAVVDFLRNELAKEPSISQVSFGNDGWNEEVTVNSRLLAVQYKNIDEQFLSTLEIPLQAGRNLSFRFPTDTKEGVLVNETFLKESGITDPIGERIKVNRDDSAYKTIRGVVKDFHFGSLREPIKPMVLYMREWPDGGMWVKVKTARQKEAMAALERIYKQAMPDAVYEYQFLDEEVARQYLQEARWQQVISIATGIAFVICCFGLFGLAHLSAHQRIKEIGIRKTLGASVSQIVALLSGSFLKLVLIAFVIAAPVSWFVMNRWLEDFAYRIHIGPGFFVVAALLALVIAAMAVSMQAVKAAIANPVKSLRTE
jgi:putative ABC transport system permease protein